MIPDYGKVYALGTNWEHEGILDGEVIVEEKIDGSQFSFSVGLKGELAFRSRGKQLAEGDYADFKPVIEAVRHAPLPILSCPYVVRGEFLRSPRHNVIEYKRIPMHHLMVWELETEQLPKILSRRFRMESWCEMAGLECTPLLYQGRISGLDDIQKLTAGCESILGGPIEGVVIKSVCGTKRAKVVMDAFRETTKQPKARPTDTDFAAALGRQYSTPMRWEKAVHRLREAGEISGSPKDIAALVREIQSDMWLECEPQINAALAERHRKQVSAGAVEGFAQWYLKRLARKEEDA
jgi:hypothetical protein